MINVSKIGLTLLLSGAISLVSANNDTLQEKTNLLQNGKTIGFLPILTPIKILKTAKAKSTIRVRGFRLENYPQMVVRDMERKELYAEFDNEEFANTSFKIIKKYEDDYGEIWHEVEGDFVIDAKNISKDAKALNLKAKKAYERTCSMCHHLPASTAYTVNQWPQQIESMMEQVALDKPTKSLIVKYLQQHAADAK